MEIKVFAVCDREEYFARKLYEYIYEKESETYEMFLFTLRNELDSFLKNRSIDILIIDEELCAEDSIEGVSHLIKLKKDKNCRKDVSDGVYKYQSRERLLKKIMESLADNDTKGPGKRIDKSINIFGVYSPVKRCFQTTFALTLGQLLSQKGKTLYLNFESFSGFSELTGREDKGPDIVDLLYFLECGIDNFGYRLGSIVERIGEMDFVFPASSYLSIMSISRDDWLRLLDAFRDYTDYDYLVLDLSENIIGLFDILRNCNRIYTICGKDEIATAKLTQYEALLKSSSYKDVFDKTDKLTVPVFNEVPQRFEMLPYSDIAEYIRNTMMGEGITV